MDRESAKKHINETCGSGWLNLVDIIFDNKPEHIKITWVFQKWAGLKVDYDGEDLHFEELLDTIYLISQFICEICGKSGGFTIIDGWDTTLCDAHSEESTAKQKYRKKDIDSIRQSNKD